ncbi:MAG: UDP-3-O-(3-hydroxymyristoyl)glucosamine N-acyltransferase [Gammaproteobacteria bacterium]
MPKQEYPLAFLAEFLGANLSGDSKAVIKSIAPLTSASSGSISFLEKTQYKDQLKTTEASAVILREADLSFLPKHINALVVADPYLSYAKISSLFNKSPNIDPGIHPTAILGKNVIVGSNVSIGAYSVIGNKVQLADGVVIGEGCAISDDVVIGENSRLYPRVVIYYGVKIGKRALVHSGAVIGADGFGMANDKGKWEKIYQLGSVEIGDDVEIGANTTIDRGALKNTIIEDGVKLDNQIQVGHNDKIGAHTAIAGCVAIAGSVTIGKHCMIGGASCFNGHIEIADQVIITGMTGVENSITQKGIYSSGIPASPHLNWRRILVRIMSLDQIAKRLQKLEKIIFKEE